MGAEATRIGSAAIHLISLRKSGNGLASISSLNAVVPIRNHGHMRDRQWLLPVPGPTHVAIYRPPKSRL